MPDVERLLKEIEARWQCPACGSTEVEALAWASVNTEEVASWDENSPYWCPTYEDHYKVLCRVDETGACLQHERSAASCQEEFRT